MVERGYCASKRRARNALIASVKKSFSIREEYRVTWSLFLGLRDRLRLETPEDLEVVMDNYPAYAWAIKTEVYLNFL